MREHAPSQTSLSIITPSYRNDLALAQRLCASIDQYFVGDYEHVLVVPRRDVPLFSALQGPRRRLVTQDEVLRKTGVRPLPLPARVFIPGRGWRTLHGQWASLAGRVSGWIVQQIIKLSAPSIARWDLVVFMDSDVQLIRPLSREMFLDGGQVVLNRSEMRADLVQHQRWLETARKLCGVLERDAPTYNYVGQLIAWRSDNVRLLHAHLEKRFGRPWYKTLLSTGPFAEYILYGVFCQSILGGKAGHTFRPSELTCSVWTASDEDIAEVAERDVRSSHVALHIQSKIPMTDHQRERAMSAATRRAEALRQWESTK
ncbi:MAG: hypothetical protein JWN04_511 [Myxococcaceae bacterium]|nr:hypothetical protein [Myxococcaceae bacterium]